jgi:nitroreductase
MDVTAAVAKRKSIRAYEPDPVPGDVLRRIVERALRAPSWGNTQPWGLVVVGGDVLQRIKKDSEALVEQGVAERPEVSMPVQFPEEQAGRYKALGKGIFEALGIERGDRERRNRHYADMSLGFGAPHIIYLHLPEGFHPFALMDGGILLQTIALLAVEEGLGTCFLARSVIYPDVVRKYAPIPRDRVLVMGITIGYPTVDHPLHRFQSERGTPEEFIQWVEESV